MNIKKIAEELKEKLSKYDDFIGLYLYGSQIKGHFKKDSDIDIVGVFQTSKDYSLDVHGEALDLELKYDVVIDFHPMTQEELELNYIYFNEIKKGFYYAR